MHQKHNGVQVEFRWGSGEVRLMPEKTCRRLNRSTEATWPVKSSSNTLTVGARVTVRVEVRAF